MTKVICGWCKKEFEAVVVKTDYGYSTLVCPNCARIVNSSIKESTGELVGRKHVHRDLKEGDIV